MFSKIGHNIAHQICRANTCCPKLLYILQAYDFPQMSFTVCPNLFSMMWWMSWSKPTWWFYLFPLTTYSLTWREIRAVTLANRNREEGVTAETMEECCFLVCLLWFPQLALLHNPVPPTWGWHCLYWADPSHVFSVVVSSSQVMLAVLNREKTTITFPHACSWFSNSVHLWESSVGVSWAYTNRECSDLLFPLAL